MERRIFQSEHQSNSKDAQWLKDIASKRRPYRIEKDVQNLERQKPVTNILKDGKFKLELEGILQGQLGQSDGRNRALQAGLQRLQDNIIPASQFAPTNRTRHYSQSTTSSAVIPVDDLRGVNTAKYTLAERQLRCKLAALYRVADLMGWGELIYNHITVSQ